MQYGFAANSGGARLTLVLDEVHRLVDPSELLKVAVDHFPKVRVVATGSSTRQSRRRNPVK